MSRKRILLPVILFAFAISCLKAKRSPFDVSSKSPTSNLIIGRALTATSSSIVTPPSNLVYSITALQSKLIPGNTTVISPTITGTVSSWTISPSTLPPGVTFDSTTGVITCSPPIGSAAFPLTNFIVTAINPGGNTSFTVPLQVLGSGENVWTVINGVSGGNTNAGINSMKYDSNCNCLIIGGSTTVNLDGQTIPSTGGNSSGFISKYDLNGNRVWTTMIGVAGASATDINGVVLDSSGNIYVAGYHGPGNFKGCTTTSSYAGYVAKYNSNGVFQWTTCTGTAQRHYYNGLLIDNNGDIVAGGTTYDSPIDGMSSSSTTDQAGILQKFNPITGARISGTIIPGNTARGTDIYGVAKDTSGKIYLVGASRASSYCGDGTTNWSPVLFRYDANMNYLTPCTGITVSSSTFAFGVTASAGGDIYISGYAQTPGTTIDGIPAIGTEDGYFAKINSSGTKLWTKRIGVSGKQTAITSIQFEEINSTLYISGKTSGSLGTKTILGTEDMFIAKYDINGNQPDSNYWTNLQGINSSSSCSGGSCKASIAFDSNRTLYSFTDTTGTISGITNAASPNRSLFLVRNVQ